MYFKFKSSLVFSFLVSFTFNVFAVEQSELIKKMMWESNEPEFHSTEYPAKWSNESAVILGQKQYYEFSKERTAWLSKKEYFHRRIKLLDKASILEYSELTYPSALEPLYSYKEFYYVGIKIVKPNGTVIEVNMNDAVVMEKKQGKLSEKYMKIAIPSLEPGDIVDYYICGEFSCLVDSYMKYHDFCTLIQNFSDKYPVVKHRLEIKLNGRCFLNIKSYNNGPELKLNDAPNENSKTYHVSVENVEKTAERLWNYKYRTEPTIKFQAYFIPYTDGKFFPLLGEERIAKNSISEQELVSYVNQYIDFKSIYQYQLEQYVKKIYPEESNHEKLIELAYNYLNAQYNVYLSLNNIIKWEDKEFLSLMSWLMKKYKIQHEYVIAASREISSIDQAVLEKEFNIVLRVNINNKYFFIIPPNLYSIKGEIDSEFQGTEAYAIDPYLRNTQRTLTRIKIPATSHLENNIKNVMTIVLNEELQTENIKAKIETIEKGESRFDAQKNLIFIDDYMIEECNILGFSNAVEKMKKKAKGKSEMALLLKDERELYNQTIDSKLKEKAEAEYGKQINSVKNFEIKQLGRWNDKPEFIYKQEIEFEGLVKKVGANYLLEVGKLIGKQIALTEEDKKRKYDIYMPYARSFTNEITIEIPAGYSVDGVETLNVSTENKTGGFVSKASLQGNKLIISSFKYYVNNFEKAEDWKLMEDFLEEAYRFTQKKVLLKKIL